MDRRDFIRNSALITLPMILKSCDWMAPANEYPIYVDSDAGVGHLIRKSVNFPKGEKVKTKYLIVGGGIAGLSCATQLRNEDFLLCELSEFPGGSSSATNISGNKISQGAHYDLSYPEYYGQGVLKFLEKLDIIEYLPWSRSWGFKDQQHIIVHRRKNQCFDHGEIRKDVLIEGEGKSNFLDLMMAYTGRMPMPSRIIEPELHELNNITFLDFLSKTLSIDPKFKAGLDYHMKDDYGAGSDVVSALAGIHYFSCRPYYQEIVELFSPPQGNHYFIEKMLNTLDNTLVRTNHLVYNIQNTNHGLKALTVDVVNQKIIEIEAEHIIYAGQKHSLKFVRPADKHLSKSIETAPWVVVNVVVDNDLPLPGFWQNEMLTKDSTLIGFVDSAAQSFNDKSKRFFTAYYCLPSSSRNDLLNVEINKEIIADKTIEHLSQYFGQNIDSLVKQVNIKVMGHAMPIPKTGYLFQDMNDKRTDPNLVYAGVDNHRLPLLFEAIDSGLQAVNRLGYLG